MNLSLLIRNRDQKEHQHRTNVLKPPNQCTALHMTPWGSSSPAGGDPSMDYTSNNNTPTTRHKLKQTTTKSTITFNNNKRKNSYPEQEQGQEREESEVWQKFDASFRQVQSVLDRNRALIQQVNENHQSKIADNMVRNVALIREINGNISKVVSLYSDLSSNFTSAFLQRNKDVGDGGNQHEEP